MFSSIGRTKISPEVSGFLHHFWEMMAYFANTLIFLIVGILVVSRIKLDSMEYWIALALFMPILGRIGIGITKEKAINIKTATKKELINSFEHHIYGENETIQKEGEKSEFLKVVVRGSVEIINEKTNQIENIKSAGAVLGVDVLYIEIDRLKYLMQNDIELHKNLNKLMTS